MKPETSAKQRNFLNLETVNDDTNDDPFDSKEEKIKDSKILIDELDPPRSIDFLPSPECDSFLYEDFSELLVQDCPDLKSSRAHGLSFYHINFTTSAAFGETKSKAYRLKVIFKQINKRLRISENPS
ncbi:hypothetical protein Tco_0356158 [Tanacetum coccineum]